MFELLIQTVFKVNVMIAICELCYGFGHAERAFIIAKTITSEIFTYNQKAHQFFLERGIRSFLLPFQFKGKNWLDLAFHIPYNYMVYKIMVKKVFYDIQKIWL